MTSEKTRLPSTNATGVDQLPDQHDVQQAQVQAGRDSRANHEEKHPVAAG